MNSSEYKNLFINHLKDRLDQEKGTPENLYTPINYMLSLGGKRLRPILTLMSTDAFNVDYKKAYDAAIAVEMFHNFTLVHDDVMDNADLRRGQQTVHKKWDLNSAILSGDVMMVMAYKFLESYPPEIFKSLVVLFSKMAKQVCEGQMYDINFETKSSVSYENYIKMIGYKTAVLIATALQMGVVIAEAGVVTQNKIYDFGYYLGLAFQLQDDYLDTFGENHKFGKTIGGDILASKKTALYIKAVESLSQEKSHTLVKIYNDQEDYPEKKINRVKALFLESKTVSIIKKEIEDYTTYALKSLNALPIPENKKEIFRQFSTKLMGREV